MDVRFSDPKSRMRTWFIVALGLHILALVSIRASLPTSEPPFPEITLTLTSHQSKQDPKSDAAKAQPGSESKIMQSNTASLAKHEFALLSDIKQGPSQAKRLKKKTISINDYEAQDKNYLLNWQNYIEEVGNKHYPELANELKIRGNLRLLVAINKDGSLHHVSLRQSSGYKILDEAAIKTVELAAPFEPLPPEIAKDVEVLEIIRTWQFRGSFLANG